MFSGGKKGCIGKEWVSRLCGNKSCKSIYKCKSKNCKLKSNFVSRDKLVSTSSKRIFGCVVPNETTYIDCNSPSVIYLMTCNRCSLPYVAGTCQKVNKKFNWQRTGFNQPDKYVFCRILSNNFHKGVCCNASYSVQVQEKLEGNGRIDRNTLNASITSERK